MRVLRLIGIVALCLAGLALVPDTPDASAAPIGDTVGLVNPATGEWHLRGSDGWTTSFFFGNPGDSPIIGDWDCDGDATPGMYRQSDGFVYLRNSNTQGIADIKFFFGNPGDVPVAGDFNNDGCDTVSIYRPSEGRFFIINKLGENNGGLGAAEVDYVFGNPGDQPFIGDFDGDGTDTVGLHRESTGFVYFRNSHTQGIADSQFFFGDPGDRLVAGDWNGNTSDSPAAYRPDDTTFYLRFTNTQGGADVSQRWGDAGWIPVAARFGLDAVSIDNRSWTSSAVDTIGDVGRFNDIAVGTDGLPLISYGSAVALSAQELKVAYCLDAACEQAVVAALPSKMFESTSIAVRESEPPIVAFYDPWVFSLRTADCADTACSRADFDIVSQPNGGGGKFAEAAWTTSDTVVIAASHQNHLTDLVVRVADTPWSIQSIERLDEHSRPSLAVGPDRRARIIIPGEGIGSAPDENQQPTVMTYPLILATCGDSECTFGLITRTTIHEEVATGTDMGVRRAAHTAVAVSHEGRTAAAISWVDGPGLELITCDDFTCSSPAVTLIDTGPNAGRFVDLEFTADGLPIVAFTDTTGVVRVAHCHDAGCSAVTTATIAKPGQGTEVSLTLDRLGMPIVAYYDATAGDLFAARLE